MNTESQTDRINQLEIERDESKVATDFANLRIEQLEASHAAMREALEGALKTVDVYCKQANAPGYSKGSFRDQWQQALSTDAGKSLLDRLRKSESDQEELKESLALELAENIKLFDLLGLKTPGDFEFNTSTEAVTIKVKSLLDRLQAVEKQAKEDKEYIEDLCAQLCKMEDALGFKNDCTDRDGAFVPTIGPWLERVRDLIAAEGEIGDLKDRLKALENQLAVAENLLLNAAPNPKFLTMGFQEKWSNEFGKWWAIRKADQTLQPAQKDAPQKGTK